MVTVCDQPKRRQGIVTLLVASDPIAELRRIRGFRDWRAFLDLSLEQARQLIPEVKSRDYHPVSRALLCAWQNGTREIYPRQVRVLGEILSKEISGELKRDIAVIVSIGKHRWHVQATTLCSRCHRPYHITRKSSKRCKRCIAKSRAQRRKV